ncbi:MAG TPA: pyridoxal phosphate-dependent aminotransferase [Deltaproteobacteria bacterium]|nr:pyridoxal phosphate-dependent aminotransferase [Deltaproteobacteria bacterium]
MPRVPHPAPAVAEISGAIFSRLASRIAAHKGKLYPLHVGDTWMEPFPGARMEDLRVDLHPGMHRYSETQGVPALIDAIVEKVRTQNRLPCERESVLVTAGATGALGAAIGMLAAPCEEILILAPYWPLIRGIAQAFRAVPIDVPFYDRVDSALGAVEAVRERITPRSVALYVSTPSNPTGRVLPAAWLEALAELARREGLWILSDEVYEAYVYSGEHVSIGRYAPERTLSAFSFSKTYGMAGNRTGYLTGPPAAIAQARKISTHTFYAAPTAGQLAALRALQHGDAWVNETRASYRGAGLDAAAVLGQAPPEGSCFLFWDVTRHCGDSDVFRFLEDCLEDGVVLAPGLSCGQDYAGWVRLCFTSIPPEEMAQAVRLLSKRLR